ncbi:MAG: galactose mutarotase [Clostridiales bacterium]|nr:galactose mutarotase [Clostridiales bacterium]
MIRKESFGKTADGKRATLYTMVNKNGMSVSVTDYGATIVSINTPDRNGVFKDIVLGFPSVSGYETTTDNFGGTIGRVCNRIEDHRTVIDGQEVILENNDNGNSLHSGSKSYNKMFFEVEAMGGEGEDSLEFSRLSPDGEQGWPGNLDMSVTFTLTDDNELILEYYAVSDKTTCISLTNHSYFNLNGHDSGNVFDHKVWINSEYFTPVSEKNVPDGTLTALDGTPMDFGTEKKIGDDILKFDYAPLAKPHGYDHNYVLAISPSPEEVELVATCYSEKTGRKLEVFTDLPGMHFYTGNWVEPENPVKENAGYGHYQGVCFETQHFPNACNVPSFPSMVYKAGEPFDSVTIFKFSVE